MADLGASDSCRGAFVEWGIMTVVAAYILEVIISSCSRELTRNAQIHDHNTRLAKNFKLPSHRRTLYERKRWCESSNSLPVEVKMLPPPKLKPHLKQWLSLRPFYTVELYNSHRTRVYLIKKSMETSVTRDNRVTSALSLPLALLKFIERQ
ncbi:hypothetical protein J6590_097718 [Homalodisca vitripennis]|nr:hypothetical protein J6590_097718 [Homalodisca vitripennis]